MSNRNNHDNDHDGFPDGMEAIELIPDLDAEAEKMLLDSAPVPPSILVLPLRGSVVFPGCFMPISVKRRKALKLLQFAEKNSLNVAVALQRNDVEDPAFEDLNEVCTMARVMKVIQLPGDHNVAVIQGISRIRILAEIPDKPFMRASCMLDEEHAEDMDTQTYHALTAQLRKLYLEVAKKTKKGGPGLPDIKRIKSDKLAINFVASRLDIPAEEKQQLLLCDTYGKRLQSVIVHLNDQLNFLSIADEIAQKTKADLDQHQREYFLQQQLRVIQDELGGSPTDIEISQLFERACEKNWPQYADEAFDKGIEKLRRFQPQTPDYSVELNYLNLMLDLPWNEASEDNLDLTHARKTLDRDHYGMEKIKDRIIEYLAVMKLKGNLRSPIICLVGPPGTGKTSLGKSIAAALDRKYVRVALGGVHDESEIRGHRRTYIGSMPGRIIKGIKRAGTANPVFVLDEIDKVQSQSIHGDPTSALLEVLDPEQNNAFHDNYLDLDYDLSTVLFIATANSLNTIQPALLDRMEIIDVSGYILEEKIEIARRHLIPRQLKEHGFSRGNITFSPKVITAIISSYTRESGVRQLEKQIARIIRKRAVDLATNGSYNKVVKESELYDLLGLPIHQSSVCGNKPRVGVVTGLAWTSVGGEILFIESSMSKGKGTLSMTGNLGDVMKESATLAFEYIKANAAALGIDQKLLEETNIHIHVPEGATPKDGPSAGITMFVAMVSVFTQKCVKSNLAMTGEITLRGNVTPVGGIREKVLAAKRAGVSDIILCEDNRRDIEDIPAEYLKGLTFHYISQMHEALPIAFVQ